MHWRHGSGDNASDKVSCSNLMKLTMNRSEVPVGFLEKANVRKNDKG